MIDRVIAGRYRIVSAIGEGGMSRVWRAQDMNTGKIVAVKVLREEFRDDETFVRRFEREAQAASRMTHPNIANLLDVGTESDGLHYLVIEYVSGITLKQFIQESGALRPETAAQIIIRVLAAVQHAHQNGVIHRDIKPQNILIDREGTVKVADFGIAQVANTQTMSSDTETVMGSVYYFSPEQAKGAAVDEKSDLYSVGVVFYEMLSGRVPFTGDTPVAIAMKHLQEKPVPPSEYNPAVSPALDFVVLHAMEKKARHRYASAADMLRDVRLALDHPETILAARAEAERKEKEARSTQRHRLVAQRRMRWMRRILVGVFSLVLLVLIGLAGYTIMERILLARQNTVEVPNVIGLHKDTAISELVARELPPYVQYAQYDLVTEDIVADQSIAPGTFVSPGEPITITVCQSNYEVLVPNVTGIQYTEAVNLIASIGMVTGQLQYQTSQAEFGLVLEQSPAPGTPANRGDIVDLTVSGSTVSMPQLIGSTHVQAEQTVLSLGLTFGGITEEVVDDPDLVGKVIRQTPDAYREIMRNSTVSIVLGKPGSLYRGTVTLDLQDVPVGVTVSIHIIDPETELETVPYSHTFTEKPTEVITVPLYSSRGGEGAYSVYYDDEFRYDGTVTYTQ